MASPHFPALPSSGTKDEGDVVHRPVVTGDIAPGAIVDTLIARDAVKPRHLDRKYVEHSGDEDITGNFRTTGWFQGARGGSGKAFQVGNDAEIHDVGVANALGVLGISDSGVGRIDLGDLGPYIKGSSGQVEVSPKIVLPNGPEIRDVGGQLELVNDAGIELYPFDTRHLLLQDTQLVVYRADGGTPVFRTDIANRKLEARDASMASNVEIFPRGTLLDAVFSVDDPADVGLTGSTQRFATETISLDYSGQPVIVAVVADVHLGFSFRAGDDVRGRIEIAGDTTPLETIFRMQATGVNSVGHDHDIPSLSHAHSMANHVHSDGSYTAATGGEDHNHDVTNDSGGMTTSPNTGSANPDPGSTGGVSANHTHDPEIDIYCMQMTALREFTPSGSSFNIEIALRLNGGSSVNYLRSNLTAWVWRA